MNKYICIHGHFYQPPRENPWLEEVEVQDSARPFHDWNERITAECYGPNGYSRILDTEGRIIDIVNNYSMISFNFGPTLLSWLERHQPRVYEAVIEADKLSMENFSGHGSAVAQVYNHMIMPLASPRDKYTQAYWGMEEFRKRYGRDPAGMWLPETAADRETLNVLADLGIRFTILAPRQAAQTKPINGNGEEWTDVSGGRVDPMVPYLCRLDEGREIVLYFYDGPISQDLAFGDVLDSGDSFKNRLLSVFPEEMDSPRLMHTAVDGETFGHHHKFGEMALSYCLHLIRADETVKLTNYAEYMHMFPPENEAIIHEKSSWSCVHGVERWRSNCGCNSGGNPGWTQEWREPLREAVNHLADKAAEVFEDIGKEYFHDPWRARDAYIEIILNRSPENVSQFMAEHGINPPSPQTIISELKLLEMQRYAQLIFTSCAWFFDEVSGIETVQILQYAVRTIQLLEELSGGFVEEDFIRILEQAPSNVVENGAEVYQRHAKPALVDLLRVGAHYAISSLFMEAPEQYEFAAFDAKADIYNRYIAGRSRLVVGKAVLTSKVITEHVNIVFAVLHPGDHNVTCGVHFFRDPEHFRRMEAELKSAFERGDITEAIRTIDEHFGRNTYSIWHLFRDQQRKVVNEVLEPAYNMAESAYRQIYESNYSILNFLDWLDIRLPRHFLDAAGFVVNTDLKDLLESDEMDVEKLQTLIGEIKKWSLDMNPDVVGYSAGDWIDRAVVKLRDDPENIDLLRDLITALKHLMTLPLGLHHWKAQNTYVEIWKTYFPIMQERSEHGDRQATDWIKCFKKLGEHLKVRLS